MSTTRDGRPVDRLRRGSLLYVDELTDRDHEMRALFESVTRTGARLRPLG